MAGRMDGPRLFLVCGLPGSGKTTLAKAIEERFGAVRFCADEWMEALGIDLYDAQRRARIEALQWRLAQQLLARGLKAIIEWGTWARAERDALRLRARELGAAVELHALAVPMEALLERIERRGMESPRIEREDLRRWAELFEAPSQDERALFDEAIFEFPAAEGHPGAAMRTIQ